MSNPLLETPDLTPGETARLEAAAVHGADFLLAGNHVRLRGNTPRPLEAFVELYDPPRFPAARAQAPDITLLYREEDADGEPSLTFLANGSPARVHREELVLHPEAVMLHLILGALRSHWAIHAACVARDGRGILIAADSGQGKSTLACRMAADGMEFLSDELAPLSRETGLVEPLPLRIGVRPGPAEELVAGLPFRDLIRPGESKKLVSPSTLAWRVARDGVRLHAVVFLTGGTSLAVATPKKFPGRVKITLTGTSDAFERELSGTTGITLRERSHWESFPIFLLDAADPESFLATLRGLLGRHDLELVGMRYEDLAEPDFTRPAVLIPLPPAAGVIELTKKIPGHHKRALIDAALGGRASLMVAELAGLLRETTFWKLTPGPLADRAACLERLLA